MLRRSGQSDKCYVVFLFSIVLILLGADRIEILEFQSHITKQEDVGLSCQCKSGFVDLVSELDYNLISGRLQLVHVTLKDHAPLAHFTAAAYPRSFAAR
jgi:hypothetical protein